MGSLYTVDPERFGPLIDTWLAQDSRLRRAGVIAAGVCRDNRFAEWMKTLVSHSKG